MCTNACVCDTGPDADNRIHSIGCVHVSLPLPPHRIELDKVRRDERIEDLEKHLADEKSKHADTKKDLANECNLYLQLEQQLRDIDPTAMVDKMDRHATAFEALQSQLEITQEKLDDAKHREEALKHKLRDLNDHKLDMIARRLGSLDEEFAAMKLDISGFDATPFTLLEHQKIIAALLSRLNERLRTCKGEVQGIVTEALTEVQKFTIGAHMIAPSGPVL